jgi:hypothetical protein
MRSTTFWPDELEDLVTVADAGDLDHDPRLAARTDLGPNLGLGDAEACHPPLDDEARRLDVSLVRWLACLGVLDLERDADAALQVETEHRTDAVG